MSLATRCPACGTVFRVVHDQLKVSEGWVRCGRCTEVFNAGQRLFDLEQDGAPSVAAGQTPAPNPAVAQTPAPATGTALSPAIARVNATFAPPSEPAEPWAPGRAGPARAAHAAPSADFTPAAQASAMEASVAQAPAAKALAVRSSAEEASGVEASAVEASDLEASAAQATAVQASSGAWVEAAASAAPAPDAEQPLLSPQALATPAAADPAPTPEFILRADRAARWRHPARRGTLAAVALLLAALLAAQMALHYRDRLAADWPAAQPWLQAACNVLGCRIEAPRRIDSLSVDSSGLVRVEGSPLYRLSLVLQNSASTVVRMPAIDLALTDTQGQTMARRVLYATELGHTADSLPPRGEVLLQATLALGEQRVAGYTVELFYP